MRRLFRWIFSTPELLLTIILIVAIGGVVYVFNMDHAPSPYTKEKPLVTEEVETIRHDGHLFISRHGSIIHHPDCQCKLGTNPTPWPKIR